MLLPGALLDALLLLSALGFFMAPLLLNELLLSVLVLPLVLLSMLLFGAWLAPACSVAVWDGLASPPAPA